MLPQHFPRLARPLLSVLALAAVPAALLAAAGTNPPGAKPATNVVTAKAATNTPPAETPIPVSVFVIPRSRNEGVDPFYPLSTRFSTTPAVSTDTNRPPPRAELAIKGFSGTPANPLVIINDKTFAAKDQFEVATPQGRVRVRCLEIRPNESAVVEVNGERRELIFVPARK
jgi:hypothetical protein